MNQKPPAFQFYADDFLAGTMMMTNEEVGLLQRLLCIQWSVGFITENDILRLSRLSANGSAMAKPAVKNVLAKFVQADDGTYRNPRLERERVKQVQFRAERAKAGRSGARSRWQNHGSAMAQPMANTMANDGFPSPSPISGCTIEREKGGGAGAGDENGAAASAAATSAPAPAPERPAGGRLSSQATSDLAAKVKAGSIRFGALSNRIKVLEAKREAKEATADDKAELKKLRADLAQLQKNHAAGKFELDPEVARG